MKLAPIVLIRNEERFIQAVLRPLVEICPMVVVGDTGSTDDTLARVRAVQQTAPNLHVMELGELAPAELGRARFTLSQEAARLGAEWIMVVDGDELYSRAALRTVCAAEMPAGAELGFVTHCSIDEDEAGQCWLLADRFNRAAINRPGVAWHGTYPFESPIVFADGRNRYHYFSPPDPPGFHAVHLHRLRRSAADAVVYMRQQKQFLFSMQQVAIPRLAPFDLAAWEGA